MVILGWKRILPNEKNILTFSKGFSYQCTPLDEDCVIEVTFSVINNIMAVQEHGQNLEKIHKISPHKTEQPTKTAPSLQEKCSIGLSGNRGDKDKDGDAGSRW